MVPGSVAARFLAPAVLWYNLSVTDMFLPSDRPAHIAAQVAINAQLLSLAESYRGAGIHGHIHNLLQRLPAAGPDLHFIAYLNEERFAAPPGLMAHAVRWPTDKPLVRILWEQLLLPRILRSQRIDLLHGLAYALPLVSVCPAVVTVHDLTFFRFPETLPPLRRVYLRAITRNAVKQAKRIIAVSQQTRHDLIQLLHIPAEKIDVVYNGVSDIFHPAAAEEVERFRQQKQLPSRFLLFLGTLEPRKNIVALLEAFAHWRKTSQQRDRKGKKEDGVKLVIAGAKGWYFDHIFARAAQLDLSDDLLFPGFLPAAELPWWYRAAECFIYPSLYEGFGLPVLEAMACGTPVITSSVSSLPEVAGDAAITVDPSDVSALATAIDQVMEDKPLQAQMRHAGRQQAARFSWHKAAAETVAIYRQVLHSGEIEHG